MINYHTKGQRLKGKALQAQTREIHERITKTGEALPSGGRNLEIHRLLVYSGLPLQNAPEEHRLVARNGMKVRGVEDLQALALIAGMGMAEFTQEYARRVV